MTTLTVGVGKKFPTCKAAGLAAQAGDRIEIDAGTYNDDGISAINVPLTIVGIGGMAHFHATVPCPNDRGLFTVGADTTFDHIEFSGAAGPSQNDAGIRHVGGNLTVTNCNFHDNQNGILSNDIPGATVTIDKSEFARNGIGGGHTHGIYILHIAKLSVSNSYFHDQNIGHHIKSRALVTDIGPNNRIDDQQGTASYSVDLPNGGDVTIHDNFIQQGPNAGNPVMIAYGAEGALASVSKLQVLRNKFLNELNRSNAFGVYNFTTTAIVTMDGNSFFGLPAAQVVSGNPSAPPCIPTNSTFLTTAPTIDQSSPITGGGISPPPPPGGGGTTPPADLTALTALVVGLRADLVAFQAQVAAQNSTFQSQIAALQKGSPPPPVGTGTGTGTPPPKRG